MKEQDFESILVKYPDLIEDGLTVLGRQLTIYRRRMDILFEDKFKRKLIVELKAGPIKDEHIGQILSYEGMILSSEDPTIRIMLIGTRVPPNIQKSLDHHGIAWREITFSRLKEFLIEKDDKEFPSLFEEETSFEFSSPKGTKMKTNIESHVEGLLKGRVRPLAQFTRPDGWARREIIIKQDTVTGYPKVRDGIKLIDTEGYSYNLTFIEGANVAGYTCLGQPGTLKTWFLKHYPKEIVIEDEVFLKSTDNLKNEFKIFTSKQWAEQSLNKK
jgi:hypothetical protein